MNYTEMEAKVREATNNEPWVHISGEPTTNWDANFWEQGASSSLMQEIANGTYN
jgi:hypothetical protein